MSTIIFFFRLPGRIRSLWRTLSHPSLQNCLSCSIQLLPFRCVDRIRFCYQDTRTDLRKGNGKITSFLRELCFFQSYVKTGFAAYLKAIRMRSCSSHNVFTPVKSRVISLIFLLIICFLLHDTPLLAQAL